MLCYVAAKTSCGIDAISTKLIKIIGDDIARPLTLIINQSVSTGVFPDKLKIAKVIHLYKKYDPHLVDNFDPFSFSRLYLKYLKRSSLIRCMPTLTEINCSTQANTAFASSTQRIYNVASLELVDRVRLDMDSEKKCPSLFFATYRRHLIP